MAKMTDEHKLIMKFLSEKALADYKAKLGSIIELRKIRVYTDRYEFEDFNFIEPRRFTIIMTEEYNILRKHGDYIDPLYKVTPAEKYPDLDNPKYIEFFTDDLLSYALEDWIVCPNCHHIHNINGGETK